MNAKHWALGWVLAALLGCDARQQISVSGQLRLDGQASGGATLFFWPADGSPPGRGRGGMAIADQEGKFLLGGSEESTPIVPGTYKVTVSRVVDATGSVLAGSKGEGPGVRETIPTAYLSPETTPLRVEIAPHTPTIELHVPATPPSVASQP